ncbi:MAG: hypothetical protein RJQ00_08010 [Vicingaceae bacterium]
MEKKFTYQSILLTIIVLSFFILMLQQFTHFSKVRKLKGAIVFAEQPEFSLDSWFSGAYQDSLSLYINENFGFRSFFVRLNNQLFLNLYKHAKANGVVVGKDDYLYEKNYIDAYYGRNFIGEELIAEKVSKLKRIQEKLILRGVNLLVVIAPGKGAYYPEHIPNELKGDNNAKTNYQIYVKYLSNSGVNYIDVNKWFLEMKKNSFAPLMPKSGTHWSRFGELKFGDSLLNYVDQFSGIHTSKFHFIDTLISSKPKFTDEDIEDGMNILEDLDDLKLAYQRFEVKKNQKENVKGMVVGDSFYWGLYNHGFSTDFFGNGQFWFYFNEVHQIGKPDQLAKNLNLKEEIEKHNVLVLLCSETNLNQFSFGFLDAAYEAYNIEAEQN